MNRLVEGRIVENELGREGKLVEGGIEQDCGYEVGLGDNRLDQRTLEKVAQRRIDSSSRDFRARGKVLSSPRRRRTSG